MQALVSLLVVASAVWVAIDASKLGFEKRDQEDEAPSGRLFVEARRGRRVYTASYDMLTPAEARRWFDAGVRTQGGKPVIFIPDADDEPARIREAFPATLAPVKARFIYPTKNPLTATFREILA